MSSPSPPSYERWRQQPSIIIHPSLLVEPARLADAHAERESDQGMKLDTTGARFRAIGGTTARAAACVGAVAIAALLAANGQQWPMRGQARAKADSALRERVEEAPLPQVSSAPRAASARDALTGAPQAARAPAPPPLSASRAFDASAGASSPEPELASIEASDAEQDPSGAIEPDLAPQPPVASVGQGLREARRLLLRRHLAEAEHAYRDVLEAHGGHAGALAGLAKVALAKGELDRALGYARKAVKRAPSRAGYHVVLGDVLVARGSTLEGDAAYARAGALSGKPLDRAARVLPPNPF